MKLDEKTKKELLQKAKEGKEMAYVPYSKFPVGAALLTESGNIYIGCNIENASYGATNCAERTALFKAVSEGETNFRALAVVSNHSDYTFPCGICRQVIQEFAQDIEMIFENKEGNILTLTIKDLLPYPFKEDYLEATKETEKDEK
ncbi:cytidine deaminase [Garciella nitratireducens]|uniref:Cytidine deaminase n=1 Tax=Garciella nitratireducens DSM 15102 TaxID=1121911 RepID=A0A1T4JRL9_9FIRM|nr:cytidine deaminase [Garciella nitratireducens]RBP45503.1 cytidine deaminase [Garciella nitratireducens]SJZ32808.1 cytidine deaminase [Garciella nitratireducens DSM 15102]